MNQTVKLTDLYKEAYAFLLNYEGISPEDISMHLIPENCKPLELRAIYKEMCVTAQNKQMSPRVIGGSIGGIDKLGIVLYNFDPHIVAKNYNKNDGSLLLKEITKQLKPKGSIRTTPLSIWPKYCETILHAAHFLSSFDEAHDFYQWADKLVNDYRSKPALPILISLEITGYGIPLSCNFLKEIGYQEYCKPDVHLKDIFGALELIDVTKSIMIQDFETIKLVESIARENQVSPYAVDKLLWLIGSGDFYMLGKKVNPGKRDFINKMLAFKSST